MGIADFSMNPSVNDPFADVTSAALGAAALEGWSSNDVGKCVKLATGGNGYQLVAGGNEIEGVLISIEPGTVNQGFSFGSVQRNRRFVAKVGPAQVGTLTIGELAVSDAQAAIGTANTGNYPLVKEGTPTTFKWRVVGIKSGTGVAGDLVVIERI